MCATHNDIIIMASPSYIKPPEGLSVAGDALSNWLGFKQRFKDYLTATGLHSEPGARQVALMLTIAGPVAVEAYNTLLFERPGDQDKPKTVLHLMEVHFSTKNKNEAHERFSFRSRLQRPDEAFEGFLRVLTAKVQRCHYGALTHSVLRDQIVCGVRDEALRERLLRVPGLTLDGAVKICRVAEMLKSSPPASMSDAAAAAAACVTAAEPACMTAAAPACVTAAAPAGVAAAPAGAASAPRKHPRQSNNLKNCMGCGNPWHSKLAMCPAYGLKCSNCGKKNHFPEFCIKKRKTQQVPLSPFNNVVEDTNGRPTFTVGAETCEIWIDMDATDDELDSGAAALDTGAVDTGAVDTAPDTGAALEDSGALNTGPATDIIYL